MNPQPAPGDPLWQGHEAADGAVYVVFCPWNPSQNGLQWRASPPPGMPAVPPPAAVLAERALAKIKLPTLTSDSNGKALATTYVGVVTWLWLDPAKWAPLSATAAVGSRSVTVTATPVASVWDMRDGSAPMTCAGPGEPFDERDPYHPPCGYTYRVSTARQPQEGPSVNDRFFHIQASSVWEISWVCTGSCDEASGGLPDMTWPATPLVMRVEEIQTVVVK